MSDLPSVLSSYMTDLKAENRILLYPKNIPGAINIRRRDFDRLSPNGWLNDVIIEFGARYYSFCSLLYDN